MLAADPSVHATAVEPWCSAKAGGADPEGNLALQQVIEQARKANVPKDIIERNLKRASDKDSATLTDEV